MKKIVIAGGTGFLGKLLEKFFLSKECNVQILTRSPRGNNHIFWDGETLGEWQDNLEGIDCLINLSGKSVDCRYNEVNKNEIIDSRIKSTHILHEAIEQCIVKPKLWINSSSATIYVHAENEVMTESNGIIGDDFSMNVCKLWESAFFNSEILGLRKVALRSSIVFGRTGGALPKLIGLSRVGMGGHQGNGKQKVSWIHESDFCDAVWFIIKAPFEGPFNITSPEPTTNRKLMKSIRQFFGLPFGLPTPTLLLEFGTWLMRTESELVLKSRNVFPERLLKLGFKFKYAKLEEALTNL